VSDSEPQSEPVEQVSQGDASFIVTFGVRELACWFAFLSLCG